MKLKSILMLSFMALCTVACSDNDGDDSAADAVAATYNGAMEMTVAGNNAGTSELSVVITKTNDATVAVSIVNEEAATGSMSLSNLTIDGVTVTASGNSTYTLTKSIPDEGFTTTDTGSANNTKWSFTSFSGTVTNGVLELNMTGKPGAMPMPINMTFTGSK